MSKLYGSIKGSAKTVATRRGHNHIEGHIRGWNLGIRVVGSANKDGNVAFHVFKTSGSNGSELGELITTIKEDDYAEKK